MSLVSIGPPLVNIQITEKSLNDHNAERSVATIKTGLVRGKVMYLNLLNAPAPSMAPASYNSSGIACSPAKKTTAINGMPIQTSTYSAAINAVFGYANHNGGLLIPINLRV